MKKQIAILAALSLGLSGCSYYRKEETKETIALIDPISEAVGETDAVTRDIIQASLYPAFVYPEITEYAFSKDVTLNSISVYLGESVKKGDLLAEADTESLKNSLDSLAEELQELEWDYLDYYEDWLTQSHDKQSNIEQYYRQQLYELDREHLLEKQAYYEEALEAQTLTAEKNGEVTAIITSADSSRITADTAVVALGDPKKKNLVTTYISSAVISNAEEIYALINGERYEVSYQARTVRFDRQSGTQASDEYSIFEILGKTGAVSLGDYGMIVVVTKAAKEVLTVLKDSIYHDDAGYYVYRIENGSKVYTSIQKGISDGLYTEIVSGLSEGDVVYSGASDTSVTAYTDKTAVLEKGSYYTDFKATGWLSFSKEEEMTNPAEYGQVHFDSYLAELYQPVKAGDPIMQVWVEEKTAERVRVERNTERCRERYQEFIKNADLTKAADIRQNERLQKELQEAEEELAKLDSCSQMTVITAQKDGVITSLNEYEKDEILPNKAVFGMLADETPCYLIVEDENGQLQYGNTAFAAYANTQNKRAEAECRVVSLSGRGISSSLKSSYAILSVPLQDSIQIAAAFARSDNRRYGFGCEVTAKVRCQDGVVLVPKEAVTEINGSTYVCVVKDGKKEMVSFLSGGHNNTCYWVVSGLTEGMVVCLK